MAEALGCSVSPFHGDLRIAPALHHSVSPAPFSVASAYSRRHPCLLAEPPSHAESETNGSNGYVARLTFMLMFTREGCISFHSVWYGMVRFFHASSTLFVLSNKNIPKTGCVTFVKASCNQARDRMSS